MIHDSQPLIADMPIDDPKQDRLDRVPLAKSLAHSILSLEGNDSFVVALCGPWGSGKTSVLNLLRKELAAVDGRVRPIVFHFNPWWFSGRNQLLEAFLSQFGAALQLPDKGKSVGQLATLFQRLSAGLRPLSLIPLIGEAARIGTEVSQSIGQTMQVCADALQTDVFEARKQIDETLNKQLDRRIVIVMDDIDRLSADEIADVFLILKAVADFPKTVYVLSFDHRVVRRAIRHKLGVNGTAYLEKIVQLQLEVPSVGNTATGQMFLEQAFQLLEEDLTGDARQDFGNLFHAGIKHFLTTPRASKKLLNTLRFMFAPLKGEVYFPNLCGIATLFTFVPSAVQIIANSQEAFVGTERYGQNRKELATFHNNWLGKISARVRPQVREIVKGLFPKCEWALDGPGYAADIETTWRQQLRVCSSEHFEKYFLFAPPSGTISEAMWAEIVSLLPDQRWFEEVLLAAINERGRHGYASKAKELLDRLEDFCNTSPDKDKIQAVIRSILRLGDTLIAVKDEEFLGGLLPWDNETRILRVLLHALKRVGDEMVRSELLTSAMQDECALLTMTQLAIIIGQEHGLFGGDGRDSRHNSALLSEGNVRKLLRKVNQLILAASDGEKGGSLNKSPFSLRIVHNWSDIGSKDKAVRWIRRQAKSDAFLVDVVSQAASPARSCGVSDYVARETIAVDAEWLARFLDLRRVKRRCERLLTERPSWLTEDKKRLLKVAIAHIGGNGEPISYKQLRRARIMAGDSTGE